MITAKEAAERTGKSKAAILKAIKSGRFSASKDDNGEWQIDPSELFRVYRSAVKSTRNSALGYSEVHGEVHTDLTAELAAAREKISAIENERSRERQQLRETIDDLRQRLDMESEERRKLTALLTDRSAEKPPQEARGGRLSRAWSVLTGKS